MDTIEDLGLKFDHRQKSGPHIQALTSSAAMIVGMARCLCIHLPPGCAEEVIKALMGSQI